MICLFIGRFQPFHNGHLHDVKNALSFSDTVKIGIGSAQESSTSENPFSSSERKEMITSTLADEGISSYSIYLIPDIHNDSEWVSHVQNIVGEFDVVFTGNSRVKKLFLEKGIAVRDVTFLGDLSATQIREMKEKGENWEKLVPKSVSEWLKGE